MGSRVGMKEGEEAVVEGSADRGGLAQAAAQKGHQLVLQRGTAPQREAVHLAHLLAPAATYISQQEM